jgi:hypothetical protein
MKQAGLFGLSDHFKRLSAFGDPLEGITVNYGASLLDSFSLRLMHIRYF